MIVVDDASSDESPEIVRKFSQRDDRIKLVQLDTNVGSARARNIAIEVSKGRYVAFLDSDDMWLPHKLEKQINLMIRKGLVLTYSSYETMDEDSRYINTRTVPRHIRYEDMLKSNHIGNLTGIYDVKYFGKVYLVDHGHEDYIMWLNLIKKIGSTEGLQKPLARYRISPTSLSGDKLKAIRWQWRIYRNFEKLGFFQSVYFMSSYLLYGLKKRI